MTYVDHSCGAEYPQLVRLPGSTPPVAFDDPELALSWLDSERENLLETIQHTAQHSPYATAYRLADGMRGYFATRLFTVDWLAAADASVQAAEAAGEPLAKAAAQISLLHFYHRRSEYPAAIVHGESALTFAHEADWPEGEIAALGNLANAYRLGGDAKRAISMYEEVLKLTEERAMLGVQAPPQGMPPTLWRSIGKPDTGLARSGPRRCWPASPESYELLTSHSSRHISSLIAIAPAGWSTSVTPAVAGVATPTSRHSTWPENDPNSPAVRPSGVAHRWPILACLIAAGSSDQPLKSSRSPVTVGSVARRSMSGYVFISYAREDRDYVGDLVRFLRGHGIEVWFDAQLLPGKRFDHAIQRKIEQCAAFIVITTPSAHASDWVLEEVDFAKERERELIPILLAGRPLFGLGRIHHEELHDGKMPSPEYVNILRGLVGEGELLFEMKAHKGQVRSVAYPARTSSMVASAGPETCVRIWHPATGQLRRAIRGATWPVSFTPHGDKIATGGPGNMVHLWDTETGSLIKQIGKHKKPLTSVAISPDGGVLVTGSSDTLEQVWDLQTGQLLRTLGGRVKPASPLVIAPDGTWLVAPTEAGSTLGACLWNVGTGQRIGSLKGHRGPVHDVTVSWDGRLVATGGEDHTARIWDANTGSELQVLGAHTKPVRAVAFSPSGYRLATGSTDQTIRLWDATTGAHIMCVTKRAGAGAGGIYDLAYAPDGRTLASGHGDGAIRIWKA